MQRTMVRRFLFWATGVLGVSLALPLFAAPANWDQLPQDRLLVTFKPQVGELARRALRDKTSLPALERLASRKALKGRLVRTVANGSHLVQLERALVSDDLQSVIQTLITDPDVAFVEPDLRMFPALMPTDPQYGNQWALWELAGGIRAEGAWDITLGTGAVVAVLDTGVRPHGDLVGNLLPGYDFVTDLFIANDGNGRDADPSDPGDGVAAGGCGSGVPAKAQNSSWHGTHVAGIVAATAFNGTGISGVAPAASILPLRVLGRCGGYTSDVVDAIYWAVGASVAGVPTNPHPARVINLSLSSQQSAACPQAYADAIAQARASGALVVIAAGNRSGNADLYPPGNCAAAFTVAATDRGGARADYSNYGSLVDIAAPGGEMTFSVDGNGILSTANSGTQAPMADNYVLYQGTSMAAPHVAGVAALLVAASPQAPGADIEDTLKASARPFPASCNGCGAGIVNAALAVGLISGQVEPALPANLGLVLTGSNGKFIKDEQNPGQGTISYVANVTNAGPEIATGVRLTNILPAAVSLETISASQGQCAVDGSECQLGSLAVGGKASVAIRVRTANDQKMDFQGQVSSDLYDPALANNFVIKRMGGSWGLMLPALLVLWLRVFRIRKDRTVFTEFPQLVRSDVSCTLVPYYAVQAGQALLAPDAVLDGMAYHSSRSKTKIIRNTTI